MDDFDDYCCWQPWKFGMKGEDLHTKLHDQYNTITLAIQDPEAFNHDVYEISNLAADVEEFHQKLEQRKQHRLDQLNTSLQSASVEIIANPKLIGTDQWQHAIQLFRTRSFDSLVRYFSSYLPEDHQWNTSAQDFSTMPFFDELDDPTPIMTHEPLSFERATSTSSIPASHLPPSPRSLTMCSDSSSVSTPARTLSFSEPESDVLALSTNLNPDYDDDTSQWDDIDSPTTPLSEISEINTSKYSEGNKLGESNIDHEQPTQPASRDQYDAQESQTPMAAQTTAGPFLSEETPTKSTSKRMASPSKYSQLEQTVRERSPRLSRPRRRSPEIGRIQKLSADPPRLRTRSLKR
ncbi:hypothetical protein GGS21DRAFT_352621 [Xylaria nigripes]|nr:hypothetical protein GGS21DRAFT_352621 [Xylaria nigripes]